MIYRDGMEIAGIVVIAFTMHGGTSALGASVSMTHRGNRVYLDW